MKLLVILGFAELYLTIRLYIFVLKKLVQYLKVIVLVPLLWYTKISDIILQFIENFFFIDSLNALFIPCILYKRRKVIFSDSFHVPPELLPILKSAQEVINEWKVKLFAE
jgi:hypothetical protein